jgi:phosphohistidine phosphatase
MKRLILLRHGKSSWNHNVQDVDRPLEKRAYNDAELIAEDFNKKTDYNFTLWSSKANRAKTTAELVSNTLNSRIDDFKIKDEFYTFDVNELLSLIKNLPNTVENMMLVGHNPAYTQIINYFCQEEVIDNLPTTGLAELEFQADNWSEIKKATLNLLLFPKHIR